MSAPFQVSGDNPVYVESAKAGGAAQKAGLLQGDMILMVNGTNVRFSTHTLVVQLIKCKWVECELVNTVRRISDARSRSHCSVFSVQLRRADRAAQLQNAAEATVVGDRRPDDAGRTARRYHRTGACQCTYDGFASY